MSGKSQDDNPKDDKAKPDLGKKAKAEPAKAAPAQADTREGLRSPITLGSLINVEPSPIQSGITTYTFEPYESANIILGKSLGPLTYKPFELEPIRFYDVNHVIRTPEITILDPATITQSRDLERVINDLKRQRDEQAAALQVEKEGSKRKEAKIHQLQGTVTDLQEKEQLRFLLERVNAAAQKALLGSPDFRQNFLTSAEIPAFVMSVDIRRSTELMLKARKPEQFAAFITTLCTDLMKIIKESFGVVDKFTGDGVLSFFPEFFSGADAGYLVVTAATRCHEAFAHHYRSFRSSFNSVLSDVGLGIGIDFGMLHLVQIAGGLTVVGQPVVYACRMGSCPAGMTLLNQPAYEKIMEKFSGHVFVQETELEIKHEGKTLAYHVSLNRHQYQPQVPDWVGSASAPGA